MWVGCHQTTLWICSNGGSQARPEVNAPMVQLYRSVIQRRARTRRMSRGLGRPMRRSARLHHLQSCGTLERSDAPNDKTTRRRCWNRHLGLRHRPIDAPSPAWVTLPSDLVARQSGKRPLIQIAALHRRRLSRARSSPSSENRDRSARSADRVPPAFAPRARRGAASHL